MPAFIVLVLYLIGIFLGEYLGLDIPAQIIVFVLSFVILIQLIAAGKISVSAFLLAMVFLFGIIRSAYPVIGLFPWEWYYWFVDFISPLRERLIDGMTLGMDSRLGDLMAGIVLGRGGGTIIMSEWNHFVVSGLSHFLVASGAHVSMMVFPIILISENVPLSLRIKNFFFALAGMILLLLLFLVGEEPSILRAITACYLYLVARIFNRRAYSLNIIYITALFWLLIDPSLIRNIGFQLSYCASWGLVYIYPKLRQLDIVKRTRRVKSWRESPIRFLMKYIIEIFLLSFSAQIALIPVLAYNFHTISLSGFIANIIAFPLRKFITYMALFAALVNLISGVGAEFLNNINETPLYWLDSIASFFSKIPLLERVKIHWLGLIIPYIFTGLFIEARFRPHSIVNILSRFHSITYPTKRIYKSLEPGIRKFLTGSNWGV